jgi:hypothetical protein
MARTRYYLILGLLISCEQSNKNTQTTDSIKATPQTEIKKKTNATTSDKVDDCVFNNDYKGLTTEWLTELKMKGFIWRADLEQALIPNGQDTVFLSKGGCYHFGMSVELKLTNDTHSLTDSAFWINRALKLAIEYQMDHYRQMIEQGRIRMAQDGETRVTYVIDDKKDPDNLEYNGIEIIQDGLNKRISISQYYN